MYSVIEQKEAMSDHSNLIMLYHFQIVFTYALKRSRLSISERIEIVKWYAIHKNADEVARQFQTHYDQIPPIQTNILNVVQKFNETGSVQDEPRSGRPRSVSTDENRERVRAAFQNSPETSSGRASLYSTEIYQLV